MGSSVTSGVTSAPPFFQGLSDLSGRSSVQKLRAEALPDALAPWEAVQHGLSPLVCAQSFHHVQLFMAPWTVACQAPLSMELARQEYWSGLPFPPLRDLPDPGIIPVSLRSAALAAGFFAIRAPRKTSNPLNRISIIPYRY